MVPFGDQKGTRYELMLNAAAAPATVSGEPFVTMPLGFSNLREGGGKALNREPGDLPSFVVTREQIGRGVSIGKPGGVE
jgi:hypothetical protein